MSNGWNEVARLGAPGARYPHILVDSHGWCLRLGAKTRTDDKFYSSLPNLLKGIVEHSNRRHLAEAGALDLPGLVREVKRALEAALRLCPEVLKNGGLEAHMRLVAGRNRGGSAPSL